MDFLQNITHYWSKSFDPRVADLPLITSSYQVPLLIFAYLYFVLGCGSRFMKNKSPYSLKTFIKLYNIVQIITNAWIIYECINAGLYTDPCLWCNGLERNLDCRFYSYDDYQMRMVRCLWYYFLLKILDLVETGIFILRKKNNQVSGLHLYHHVSVLFLIWLGVRNFAVSPATFIVSINCMTHTIMYTYYFLAAFGPRVQKLISPIKPCITIIQMIQFVGLFIYISQNLHPNCYVIHLYYAIFHLINLIINFCMFYNFYQKTYKTSKKKAT